jgi:hypothetical protein
MRTPTSMSAARRHIAALILSVVLVAICGCATQQVPPYQPGIANQTALSRLPRASQFNVGASSPNRAYTQAQVRGLRIAAPGEQPWGVYLTDALRTELTTAGHYDGSSSIVVEVALISLQIADGKADATAHFLVRDKGTVRYDKNLNAHADWSSQFLGVLAAQDGLTQASAIFQTLLGKLFKDPEFIKVV